MPANPEPFKIRLDSFEGPFDLLYELITNHEINIYEIKLSEITREYLSYVRRISQIDIDMAGEFLLIATVLMELKSKSLFPKDEPVEDVELLDPQEAREHLVQRLIDYKMFKNASVELLSRHDAYRRFYPREAELDEQWSQLRPDLYINNTADDLCSIYMRLQRRNFEVVDASHMISVKYTVEDKAAHIISKLRAAPCMSFRQLTAECMDRMEIVFCFLAILELMKSDAIECSQFEAFGDMQLSIKTTGMHSVQGSVEELGSRRAEEREI